MPRPIWRASASRARRTTSKATTAGSVKASDGEALRHLALAGAGLARLPACSVAEDIRAGRLRPVLEDVNPGDRKDVHAVYLGQGGPLPARVRVLLDFLAERARVA